MKFIILSLFSIVFILTLCFLIKRIYIWIKTRSGNIYITKQRDGGGWFITAYQYGRKVAFTRARFLENIYIEKHVNNFVWFDYKSNVGLPIEYLVILNKLTWKLVNKDIPINNDKFQLNIEDFEDFKIFKF